MHTGFSDVAPQDRNRCNKEAWDTLYASTKELIWGMEEAGFLKPFLARERAAGRQFERALDAATGEGRNLPFLQTIAREVCGCDSSAAAMAKIPARIRSSVRLEACDLGRTPFPDDAFNFILLCDTIETVPDPVSVMREMRRIVAPDGVLLCNFPVPEGDVSDGGDMVSIGDNRYLYRGRYYYRFFRDDEVRECLRATGWRLQRAETMVWHEPEHPQFRAGPHQHRSHVCLLSPADQRV